MASYRGDEHDDDAPVTCAVCGAYAEWVGCWRCGGDGYIDEYEDDAVNYAPGEELTPCRECGGQGGWMECTDLPHDKGES